MTERDQLIDNIIVSEIDYKKKIELLKTETDPTTRARLKKSLPRNYFFIKIVA